MTIFLYILIGPVILFVIVWIIGVVRCLKNPDVRAASALRMDIRHYRQYKELYDAHAEAMHKYGTNSYEANQVFKEGFLKIKNPNEWRLYQEFRFRLSQQEWEERLKERRK